jgi:hypothetical protein
MRARDPVPGSERKIVVLVFERRREIVEAFGSGCGLAASSCRSAVPRRVGLGLEIAATAPATATEHQHLADVDFRRVPGLSVLVLPLTVLDSAFDVELVTLVAVLLDDVG